MGYLRNAGGVGDLKKAIISIWFRIPAATAAAARSPRKIDLADDRFCMQNFVPLISFGPQQTVQRYTVVTETLHHDIPLEPPHENTIIYHDGTVQYTTPSGPTFIGVYYGGDSGLYPDGSIIVNIQTSGTTSLSNVFTDVTSATYNEDTAEWDEVKSDGSHWYEQQPDCYFGYSSATNFRATTDRWHHLLVSWDVSNGCSGHGNMVPVPDDVVIDSVSKMWAAFNNVNYSEGDLPAAWANDITGTSDWGDNDIVSTTIANWAGVTGDLGDSTSSLTVSSVPSNPVCIPGPPSQVYQEDRGSNVTINSVRNVVESKIQVFGGLTLDTSVEANRRLFITAGGIPEDPAVAAAALGVRPRILFNTGDDLIKGLNRGSGASFRPTGTIGTFSPGPGL